MTQQITQHSATTAQSPAAVPNSFREAHNAPVGELPRIPIVLGISGHVNPRPDDLPALRRAFAEIVDDFRRRYPHTPIWVMSSLARGGDQIAAEVALEKADRVIAPLPFPPEVYAQSTSFRGDDAARDRFLDWASNPDWRGKIEWFVVHRPDEPEADDRDAWTDLMTDTAQRHSCYAGVGGYIVRHCHALVVFWNNEESKTLSGTAEMVDCKRVGRTPQLDPWRSPRPLLTAGEYGPVYAIHTPRLGEQTEPAEPQAPDPRNAGDWSVYTSAAELPVHHHHLRWRATAWRQFWRRVARAVMIGHHGGPHTTASARASDRDPKVAARQARDEIRQFHETCQTVESFNRDVEAHAAIVAERLAGLPQSELGDDAGAIAWPEPLVRLMRLRGTAAAMASYFETRFTGYLFALFLILFLAAASFHLYAHYEAEGAPGERYSILLLAFVALLGIDVGIVLWVWGSRLGERRHDYRALAETLRVRIFWGVAGISLSVAESYLGQVRSEMAWTRRALQTFTPPPRYWRQWFRRQTPVDQLALLRRVESRWVHKQVEFFKASFHENHGAARSLRRWGLGLAVVGWGLGLAACGWVISEWRGAITARNSVSHAVPGPRPVNAAAAAPRPSGSAHAPVEPKYVPRQVPAGLLIGSGILVLAGAIVIAFCERRSFEELARQYEQMWIIFSRGRMELSEYIESGEIQEAQRVLEALGEEAIADHAQWLILRRNRPFELLIH